MDRTATIQRVYDFLFTASKMLTVVTGTAVGLGGLGLRCSPRDPRFAGSNPAEVDGFFQDVKS